MPLERHGLAFAAKGFSILPLYFPNKDGSCSCSKGKDCPSPGKHPLPKLAPNGVYDATRDVKEIATWWQSEARINLGVACGPLPNGKNLVVFDIDNTQVARAVLDPEIGIMDETATAGTGKGCHVYTITDAEVKTHDVFLAAGPKRQRAKVGEIRSAGAYVAAPPSKHFSGVRYRWFGQPEDDESIPDIMRVADVDKFVARLCARAGFPLEPVSAGGGEMPDLEGSVEAIDMPFDYDPSENSDTQRLWMISHPQGVRRGKPEGARSVDLYEIGHLIVRVAAQANAILDAEQIMGIVKKVDTASFGKYSNRKDPDKEYNRIVRGPKGVFRKKDGGLAETTQYFIDHPTTKPTSKYGWDEERGMLVIYGAKSDTDLCNFRPIIEEELEIDSGDEVSRAYKATFIQPTGSVSLYILPEHLEGERGLRRKFYEECPVAYNVYPEGWRHLPSILREGIKDVTKRRVYRHSGWIDTQDGRAFILQGSGGAITPDDILHELAYEEDPKDNLNPKLRLYGVGVRPIITERDAQRAERALIGLIRSATPGIVIPIIAQVIAGPLVSHGADEDPPLVHITGRTGSMKTSLATACLSIFGMFNRANVPESWMSTLPSLQATLYYVKDLTLMIDDYKTGTVGRVANLIQQYSDRTTRSRMGTDQRMRKRLTPRGLMLSTGEDMWEDQESIMARTIIVDMTKEDVNTRYLKKVQESYVPDGWLQLVGGGYVAWLAGWDPEELTEAYNTIRSKTLKLMQEALSGSIHGRLVGVLASLIAASRIFERFLKAELPNAYAVYKAASRVAWAARSSALAQQGEEAREHSPYNQVISDLRSGLHTKDCRIVHTHNDGKAHGGGTSAPIVGFFDDAYVYIGRSATWQWFSKRRQQRGEAATFTWRSVLKDARSSVKDASEPQLWTRGGQRVIRLPKSELGISGSAVDSVLADITNQAEIDEEVLD